MKMSRTIVMDRGGGLGGVGDVVGEGRGGRERGRRGSCLWRFWWCRAIVMVAVFAGGGGGRGVSAGGVLGGGLQAVVGPSLMTRLVETEAVARVAAAADRECCGLSDPTATPLTRHWLSHPHAHGHTHAHTTPPSSPSGDAAPAVCNDNSPAGFYLRRSVKSRRWVMFLEGGWYCFDRESCEQRWHRLRPLMTSRGWPETRTAGGVLSPNPEDNPHWWTANHVLVPYCSSDSWAGTKRAEEGSGSWSFLGSVIVEQVVAALLQHNFTHGHKLILAGSSAGGVGVLVNVDRVAQQLARLGVRGEVRAVADSGWFLDNEPFKPLQCVDAHSCPPVEAIRRGHELWQGRIPESCGALYPRHPWFCYFGYRLYPTLQSPLFVFQWVFDEAQMTVDNVGKPNSKQQWDYIHGTGERLRRTLQNVTALFAPSCISHTVLTKRNWAAVKIGDVSLPQALYCWDITPFATLTARKHATEGTGGGGGGGGGSRVEEEEGEDSVVSAVEERIQEEEVEVSANRRAYRHQKRGDRKTKRQRHAGGGDRRRAGDRSRRRRGKRRNRKNRRRPQNRTRTQYSARNQTEEVKGDAVRQEGNAGEAGSDGRDTEGVVSVSRGTGRLGEHNLGGEMLADSPENLPHDPLIGESNAIARTSQDTAARTSTHRPGNRRRGKEERKRKGRRRKGKKRSRSKERERKMKKRERRRKRKERRRRKLQLKKRKKKRERRLGERELNESMRPARSLPSPSPPQQPAVPASPSQTLGTPVPFGGVTGGVEEAAAEVWTEDLCPARILHLTDRCAWPHCNYACPRLLNPFTGEEMNFTELLKSFGLDMASVASALGIDIHTLNSMGNDELLLILTQ
ncbi:palmitoleoyl-protein carboxylesterase NOTUM-like [Eriocheir sinensis]|uniref:palmitoleoyl-protein carboxylesterase NOTUM-like n=1 Tax=Eriocheir sinensis TaxID=95602 RepID=UPI0021C76C73|nr:palmitoleoyl-protein carboxylesterase NOTUM-like [Eriocheir sinensis]